jgi:hypothetical protein
VSDASPGFFVVLRNYEKAVKFPNTLLIRLDCFVAKKGGFVLLFFELEMI